MNAIVPRLRLRKDPRDVFLTTLSRQKVQIKSGEKLVLVFSLWGGHEVTDEGFYQWYEAPSRVVPPRQFTKDQPMREPLFQSVTT